MTKEDTLLRRHHPIKLVAFRPMISPLVISIVLLLLSFSSLAQTDTETREAKLNTLKQTIETLKEELQAAKGDRSDLVDALESSEKKISELNEKIETLKAQLKLTQVRLNDLHTQRGNLLSAKKQQRQQVSQHLNAAYRLGKQSSLKLILNQSDPAKVARHIKYFDYVIRSRTQHIEAFNETLVQLDQIEPEIQFERSKIINSRTKINARLGELKNSHAERKHIVDKLNKAIKSKDLQLQAKENDRKRLESLLQRVVRIVETLDAPVNNQKLSKKLKGKLPWPTHGKVLHRYGSSRISGKIRWQGALIGAEEGSDVRAVHHGRIVFSDYLRSYGLLVIVDHGSGFLSLYAHNQSLFKSVGEWVDTGDVIASVGNSGGQQQTGLYFELRHNGSPTNPHSWLRKSA